MKGMIVIMKRLLVEMFKRRFENRRLAEEIREVERLENLEKNLIAAMNADDSNAFLDLIIKNEIEVTDFRFKSGILRRLTDVYNQPIFARVVFSKTELSFFECARCFVCPKINQLLQRLYNLENPKFVTADIIAFSPVASGLFLDDAVAPSPADIAPSSVDVVTDRNSMRRSSLSGNIRDIGFQYSR